MFLIRLNGLSPISRAMRTSSSDKRHRFLASFHCSSRFEFFIPGYACAGVSALSWQNRRTRAANSA